MNKLEFDLLQKIYSPIIKSIIESNARFYRTNKTIHWCLGLEESSAIMGSCNRKTNIVTINVEAVYESYRRGEPLQVEYFILHEIRHIYQHLEVEDYKKDPSLCNNSELAKQWYEEEQNYVRALDVNENENEQYFLQDMELDAYAYAYAVMLYKYGKEKLSYLYMPRVYDSEVFLEIIDEWIRTFTKEGL